MNLVSCSKDCAYQKDGYCCLTDTAYVSNSKVDGCCYYRKLSNPQPMRRRKSRWNGFRPFHRLFHTINLSVA